jgi:hypothetical protein
MNSVTTPLSIALKGLIEGVVRSSLQVIQFRVVTETLIQTSVPVGGATVPVVL